MKQLGLSLLFMVLSTISAYAQTGTVSGKIIENNNEPVAGANILIK